MSKTLSFSKERVRVLVSNELDLILGGQGGDNVSSALPDDGNKVSSALPTATAVSSAKPEHHHRAKATATAVSSARPGGTVSSALPTATAVSSALPSW